MTPKPAVQVFDYAGRQKTWADIHELLHHWEEEWATRTELGKRSMIVALSMFLGGHCAKMRDGEEFFQVARGLMTNSYTEYDDQMEELCLAHQATARIEDEDGDHEREAN